MKQKPIVDIETIATEKALNVIFEIRPDLLENRAAFALLAREANRNLIQALYSEGYIQQPRSGALPPQKLHDMTAPFLDFALGAAAAFLAKKVNTK